ncbi:Ig-like domain-containing protein [Niabella sp. CJ426]|uniref:Ig-like domain-containing protein n=1 Tax=Niabella sp. CJ426 TaxID=3393740 RepID=UPI003D05E85B
MRKQNTRSLSALLLFLIFFNIVTKAQFTAPACNTPVALGTAAYPATIYDPFTPLTPWTGPYGIDLGAVTNQDNAVGNATNDYASMSSLASLLGGQRLTVQTTGYTVPGGYYVGFDIQVDVPLSASLLKSIKITTFNQTDALNPGVGQENITAQVGSSTASVLTDLGRWRVGFVTTQPFNRVQIDVSNLLSVVSNIRVYHATIMNPCNVAKPVCPVSAAANATATFQPNVLTNWVNPTFPVYNSMPHTVVSNLAALNSVLTDIPNVIDSDPNNYSRIQFLGTSLGSTSLAVRDAKTIYEGNQYFVGWDVEDEKSASVSFGTQHVVTTYLNGTEQESFSDGLGLGTGSFFTSTGRMITGFRPTKNFDEVSVTNTTIAGISLPTPFRVYQAKLMKLCAGPALVCNTNTRMVYPTYPVFVDGKNTATNAIGAINNEIIDPQNAIDASTSNYTVLNLLGGIGTATSYGITDGGRVYAANSTFAGFDVSSPGLFSANALSQIQVSATLNGVVVQTKTGSAGLVGMNSFITNGSGRQTIGFVPTVPFDGLKIVFTQGGGINFGETRVYSPVFKTFCAATYNCKELTRVQNPSHAVYVNMANTGINAGGCAGCSINNSENIINNMGSSNPATINLLAGAASSAHISVANASDTYPAGSFAGFDIQSASLLSGSLVGSITIDLYNNGALVHSGTGTSLLGQVSSDVVTGGASRGVVGIVSPVAFDEVKFSVNQLGGGNLGVINIYGFYVQADLSASGSACLVPCGFNGTLNSGTAGNSSTGAIINSARTGVIGGACAACKVEDPWNVVSPSLNDYAVLHNIASGATQSSVSVATPSYIYPAGSYAGFIIDKNPFVLGGALLPYLTVRTYLNGKLQQTVTNSALFDFSFLFQWVGTPTAPYSIGFVAVRPFDEIQLSVGNLASVADQNVRVYGAFADIRNGHTGTDVDGNTVPFNCQLAPVYNPDINMGYVNTSIEGNVKSNDKNVAAGTQYQNPVPTVGASGVANPTGATINVNSDGTYTFTATQPGVYNYLVNACNGGTCTPVLLTITVLENGAPGSTVNPPVANTDITSTMANTPITYPVKVNDQAGNEGGTLGTPTIETQPKHGTATVGGTGDIVYTPANGFVGTDTLVYKVCETPSGKCALAYEIITVQAPGSANTTTAADDYVTTKAGTAVTGNVKANDTDAEGDAQTVVSQNVTNTYGTLNLGTDGSFTYTPAAGFTGTAKYVYTVRDNGSPQATATATLYILVTGASIDLGISIQVSPTIVTGEKILDARIVVFSTTPTATDGSLITARLLKSSNYTLEPYQQNLATLLGSTVYNVDWQYVGEVGAYYVFEYKSNGTNKVINGLGGSAIGVKIKFNGQQASGKENITTSIKSGSGGDSKTSNNADSDAVNFAPSSN